MNEHHNAAVQWIIKKIVLVVLVFFDYILVSSFLSMILHADIVTVSI